MLSKEEVEIDVLIGLFDGFEFTEYSGNGVRL